MFNGLTIGWQYLYVFLFSLLVGMQAPFGGGLGLWVTALAVSSGTVVLAGHTWADQILTHSTLCFWAPLLLLVVGVIVFFICLIFSFILNPLIMSPLGAGSSSGAFASMVFCLLFLGFVGFSVYVQLNMLHLSGSLWGAAVMGVLLGMAVVFLGFYFFEPFLKFFASMMGSRNNVQLIHMLVVVLVGVLSVYVFCPAAQYFLFKQAGKQIHAAKAVAAEAVETESAAPNIAVLLAEQPQK